MFYKRFVISTLFIITILLGGILFFNYKYDPANIYNDELTSTAVGIMLKGKHVVGLSNYDERKLKKAFIINDKKNFETVVLGSSRSMSITSNDNSLRNYSVSGAVLEDILGLWNALDESKNYNNLIIGVDSWIFNENSGETRWKTLYSDYLNAVNKLGSSKDTVSYVNMEKYWQLLSIDYLKASIKKMKNKSNRLEGVDTIDGNSILLLKDGSIHYGYQRNAVTEEQVDREIKTFLKGGIYHLEGFTQLDNDRINLFKEFLKRVTKEKKKVVLYLTPYHPEVYEYLKNNNKYKMVSETEKFIKEFKNNPNIEVIGSFNPQLCGLNESDFMDAMHLKNNSSEKFWEYRLPAM